MMGELLVKLQIYEGPLDLLLHLIKKNEVDLNDIPVALITAQYLEYLDLMEAMNVELAADFLLMAATLTQIKSKLLLPHERDEDDETDPDEELKAAIIDPLLERLRRAGIRDFREAAEALRGRQFLNGDVFVRGGSPWDEDLQAEAGDGLTTANLFDLVDAFRRLAGKRPAVAPLKFVVEGKTIGQRIAEIRGFLKERRITTFEEICGANPSRDELVLSFLAVLELARTGFLKFYQKAAEPLMRIFLANPEAEMGDLDQLDY